METVTIDDEEYEVVYDGVNPCSKCKSHGVIITNNGIYCSDCKHGIEWKAIFVSDQTEMFIEKWNEQNPE